jgi:hypothetical protein
MSSTGRRPLDFGVGCEKKSKQKPRFAIRFSSCDDIEAYTKSKDLPTYVKASRWRLEGLAPTIGAAGAIQFLETKNWKIHEMLYFGERHLVFTSTQMRVADPMHYRHPGSGPQQLRFKALNSFAKKEQSDAAKAARSTATASSASDQNTNSQKKIAFLRTLPTKTSIAPSSPRQKKDIDKRPAETRTGQTPPAKQPDRNP